MWVRLPKLPIEYYEPSLPKKISHAIGPVLRIDAHTKNGARGKFAHLCIHVNLEKPIPMTVYIGQKRMQPIQYKMINQLCFCCGCIGHRKEGCAFMVRSSTPPSSPCDDPGNFETYNTDGKETFGEWMVVTRKKRTTVGRKLLLLTMGGSFDSTTVKVDVPNDPFGKLLPVTSNREGKRKAHIPIEKVNTQPVLSNSGRQRKGKGKMANPKISSSKPQSVSNSLGKSQLETNFKSLSHQKTLSPQPLPFPMEMAEAVDKWAIFLRNKVIPVGEETIEWIQSNPTSIWGWYDPEIKAAGENIFPLTEKSKALGFLEQMDSAWILTPNPWWYFLMDLPRLPPLGARTSTWSVQTSQMLISESLLTELEKDLVSTEIVQRKILLETPMECAVIGNLVQVKLLQFSLPVIECNLLVKSSVEQKGNPQACSDIILRTIEDEGTIDASMEIEGDRG